MLVRNLSLLPEDASAGGWGPYPLTILNSENNEPFKTAAIYFVKKDSVKLSSVNHSSNHIIYFKKKRQRIQPKLVGLTHFVLSLTKIYSVVPTLIQ